MGLEVKRKGRDEVKHPAGDSDLVASGNLFMETEQGTSVFLLVKISVTDQCEISPRSGET